MKTSSIKNKIFPIVSIIFWIFIWFIASHLKNEELVIPYPYDTFNALIRLLLTKEFYISLSYTLVKAFIGFIISSLLGIIIGILCGLNKFLYELFLPVTSAIKSTPVISIVFILIIMFGTNKSPIFVNFLISFPIIWSNIVEGIKNVDIKLLQMAKVYKISKWRVLMNILFPSIFPYLNSAMSTALGLGWKATVTAEAISQPKYAIGTNLFSAKMYLNTTELFAWTIAVIILGYLFEKIFKYTSNKLIMWRLR